MNRILEKVKSALCFIRRLFIKTCKFKIRKTSRKQDGRLHLSCKLEIKPADPPHTHTQTEYYNPRAHAR